MEVLDPRLASTDTGEALNILAAISVHVTSIVVLAQVYDGMGKALLRAASDAPDDAAFGQALAALADDDASLASVAATFHDLSALGPRAAALAQRILADVVAFARAGGR